MPCGMDCIQPPPVNHHEQGRYLPREHVSHPPRNAPMITTLRLRPFTPWTAALCATLLAACGGGYGGGGGGGGGGCGAHSAAVQGVKGRSRSVVIMGAFLGGCETCSRGRYRPCS